MATLYREITFDPKEKITRRIIKLIVKTARKGYGTCHKNDVPLLIVGERTIKDMDVDKSDKSDRRLNFLDSSIWIRYTTKDKLQEVKDEIKEYHKRGLYDLPKAKESKYLMERLVSKSYLDPVGGHENDIVPFLFHSESGMKEVADKIISSKILYEKKWRFLLVDDEAIIKEEKDETERIQCSRCKIIKDVLSKDCKISCKISNEKCPYEVKAGIGENEEIDIEIVCSSSIDETIDKLANPEEYDIVLMDYLLGKEKDKNGKETEVREYSDTILKKIKEVFNFSETKEDKQKEWIQKYFKLENSIQDIDDKEKREKILKKIKGVNGRFWFFFISAYNIAVRERLINKQFLHNTEYWHIEEGASPITTPHLFRYLLFSLMKRQIEAITRLDEHKDKDNIITLIDLLNKIYEDSSKARETAIDNFNNLMRMRLKYDKIKYDIVLKPKLNGKWEYKKNSIEQSPLAKSLFPDIEYYDNAFWEHTMHLVYLTAFGTIRQWHDMWDEFMLIKPILQKASQDDKCKEKAENIIKKIEEYITKLQEQSKG